nr:hypothetical protein [Oscillochloris trichoides]
MLLDQQRHVRGHIYRRSNGQSHIALLHALREAEQTFAWEQIAGVGLTGSGGERIAQVLGGQHVNELIAQTRAVSEYCLRL